MKNQRSINSLPLLEDDPTCDDCGSTRVLKSSARDSPLRNKHGGQLLDTNREVYMCYHCHNIIGYVDNRFKPADIIAAHSRPDLSAKYEGSIKHV